MLIFKNDIIGLLEIMGESLSRWKEIFQMEGIINQITDKWDSTKYIKRLSYYLSDELEK